MTVTLDLAPEEEQNLRWQAELAGKDVSSYVQGIVREQARPHPIRPSHEEWTRLVRALVNTVGPDVPPLSDYALSREGMYEGRY